MEEIKNKVFVECGCRNNAGWLDIEEKDYEIDCNNCGRVYRIKSNGEYIEIRMKED